MDKLYLNIARTTIETTLQSDVPQNNHNVSALHGIIALRQGDASAAHQSFTRAIEAALQYDVPSNNHNATALHGIIALRQGDVSAEQQSFTRAIAQADEILAKTPEYYDALDAKGLALCGLALCADNGQRTMDNGNGQSSMVYRQQAIETFKHARMIAPHAGVVKSVLRLFDELVKCDEAGILKDVRKAVEGV